MAVPCSNGPIKNYIMADKTGHSGETNPARPVRQHLPFIQTEVNKKNHQIPWVGNFLFFACVNR